jgi:RND family efflux transporter MFP subunit
MSIVPIFACVIAMLLAGCGHSIQDVQVAHAESRDIKVQPGGLGTVAASVDVPVSLQFRDTVTAVHVSPGDKVTQGQPILDLDPAPLATNTQSLQFRLDSANAAAQKAQSSLASSSGRSSTYIAGLQAQLQALQGQIGLDQQLLSIAGGHTSTVVSPINGVIQAVNVQAGQSASSGKVLADVVDFTRVIVTANLPVTEQADVTVGANATITFPDFPNLTLNGSVTTVSAGATNHGTSFQATIDAANTPDLRIRPGVNAYARVQVVHKAALTVPREAVLNIDLNPTVFVVSGQIAHQQSVQVGISDDKFVEILSGLQNNDICVLVGNQSLADGTPVRISKDEG